MDIKTTRTPHTLDEVINFVRAEINFSLSRWGDGEFAALFGDNGSNCDGVKYESDMEAELWTILDSKPTYTIGKQPFHDGLYSHKRKEQIEAIEGINWVNADMFHEASKQGRLKPFLKSLKNRRVLIVGNKRLSKLQTFFDFELIPTPDTNAWGERNSILKRISDAVEDGMVVLFACGITSNWLIDSLHYNNNATFIDVGSLLDPFVGEKTRRYHSLVNLRQATPINVTMATVPKREKFAQITIDSIMNCNFKPDSVHIELNGFNKVPKWVLERDVTYTLRKENIGAKAKFARLDSVHGYYLTIDDDIEYSAGYIGHMTNMIEMYDRKCLVGIHGSTHRIPKIRSYWNDAVKRYHFQGQVKENTLCSMLGTGTLGFHTSLPLHYKVFERGNMTDPYLSKWAIENNVKQICLRRNADFVKQIPKSQDTGDEIWKYAMSNDTEQTNVINSINRRVFIRYMMNGA